MLEGSFFLLVLILSILMVRFYRNSVHSKDLTSLEKEIESDFVEEIKESDGSELDPVLEWIENEQTLDTIEDLKKQPKL
jgi:hypothetical protein